MFVRMAAGLSDNDTRGGVASLLIVIQSEPVYAVIFKVTTIQLACHGSARICFRLASFSH